MSKISVNVEQPKLKIIYDQQQKRKGRGISFSAPAKESGVSFGKTTNDPVEKRPQTTPQKPKKEVPGPYKFPKENDFIHREHTMSVGPETGWSIHGNAKINAGEMLNLKCDLETVYVIW